MFVDVCFPKDNELLFIEVAKKLNTRALCFVYDNLPKELPKNKGIKIYFGSIKENKSSDVVLVPLERNIVKNKKVNYYFLPQFEKHGFHTPIKSINQVVAKELKNKDKFVGFSFNVFLKTKEIEKTMFVVNILEKYNVNMFLASFATSPYELRSASELMAVASELKMCSKTRKKMFSALFNYFNSATFL